MFTKNIKGFKKIAICLTYAAFHLQAHGIDMVLNPEEDNRIYNVIREQYVQNLAQAQNISDQEIREQEVNRAISYLQLLDERQEKLYPRIARRQKEESRRYLLSVIKESIKNCEIYAQSLPSSEDLPNKYISK